MRIAGMSIREYKKVVRAACLAYLNEYRRELGLEPVEDLQR